MDFPIAFLIDVVLTALGYLLVPLTLCVVGKKLTLPQIKKVVIINGICVWLIFQIIKVELGGEISAGGAVFLWSYIAYSIMKKKCLKKDDVPKVIRDIRPTVKTENVQQLDFLSSERTDTSKTHGNGRFYGSDIALEEPVERQFCKQCGQQLIKNAKFCNNCGAEVVIEEDKPQFCIECGRQLIKNAKFCNNCGTKVSNEANEGYEVQ